MIHRQISSKIASLSKQYPIVTVTGPRQSGKSTLLRAEFPDYKYVSLEDPDMREFATSDPRGFLATYPDQTIIDEAERVPALFSYLQTHVDAANKEGMYLLAGSRNFLLMEGIDQSLAGRTAILKLLPFSRKELHDSGELPNTIDEQIFTGFYPRVYDKKIHPTDYYPSYIQTYVERDLRLISNISDLNRFVRFLRLCAGRVGQILNKTSLATECGCTMPTVEAWLSILEASDICHRLEPNFNNHNKRIIKSPKLYFYDTGLVCNLLGITDAGQVATHYLRGSLFENLVVNQFVKDGFNRGITPDLTFWRDSSGNEVDLIQTKGTEQWAYEIKSGATFSQDFFKGLVKWASLSSTPAERLSVIYGGVQRFESSTGNVVPFPLTF